MYSIFVGTAIIICIAALVITLMIAKVEGNKIKRYNEEGNSGSAQFQRSEEYEKRSLKENLPLLAILYIVTFLIVLIIMLIFLFG